MNSLFLALCFFGYGVGFEGVDGDKVYIGTYTPTHEYGWVMENGEIWLDVVMEKNEKNLQARLDAGR